jgi:hypothetical protein
MAWDVKRWSSGGRCLKTGRGSVGRWVPKQERSRSLALVYSGMYTGSILGLALSPHMVSRLMTTCTAHVLPDLAIVHEVL